MNISHFSKNNVTEFIFFFCPLNDFSAYFTYLSYLSILSYGFAILSHLLRSLSQGFKVILFKETCLGIRPCLFWIKASEPTPA